MSKSGRPFLRRDFYERLGELARTDPARLGAILQILEQRMDDLDAIDAALTLLLWAGSPDGDVPDMGRQQQKPLR